MPYIKTKDRKRIECWVHESVCDLTSGHASVLNHLVKKIKHAGELNYVLTRIVHEYLNQKGKSYQTMNDIVGALDNAKDEFRRRVQHPYEDEKVKINGDVIPNV